MYKKIKRKKKKGKKCPCAQMYRMPGQYAMHGGTVSVYSFEIAGDWEKRG